MPNAPVQPEDLPFLRFAFHRFVLTFPMIKSAPPEFFTRLQQLAQQFYQCTISDSGDREEPSKRRKAANRVERYLTLLLSSAIIAKPPPGAGPGPGEEIVDLTPEDRQHITAEEQAGVKAEQDTAKLAINIIAVRLPSPQTRQKPDLVNAQFIVASSAGKGTDEVYVARSYTDFEHFKITLQKEVGPLLSVPDLPPKDYPMLDENPRSASKSLSDRLFGLTFGSSSSPSPTSPNGADSPVQGDMESQVASPVLRETNRLSLRAFLRDLAHVPAYRESTAMQEFLHASPVQLTEQEMEDASLRSDLDVQREAATVEFAQASEARAAELRSLLGKAKYEVSQPNGLVKIFDVFRSSPTLDDLPEDYRSMMGWVKMSFAASLYTTFIGSDYGNATFASFSRVNFLMPYALLKQVLKITNPSAMIKGILNVFLAQPMSSKSLLQRMCSASLAEGTKQMSLQAQSATARIGDSLLVQKLNAYVHLTAEEKTHLKTIARSAHLPLPIVVLSSDICGPAMSPAQAERVEKARISRSEGEFTGPSTLLDDFHALMVAQLKIHDHEQFESLVADGTTGELFKDFVAMFVTPLTEVYREAHAADFVGDVQLFCDDLIQTVKSNQTRKSSFRGSSRWFALTLSRASVKWQSPTVMLQVFQDLVDRHEKAMYRFFHQTQVNGQALFARLIEYFQKLLDFLQGEGQAADALQRQGIGEVDLEALLPAVGDPLRDAVLQEADTLINHAYTAKWLREVRLRRQLAAQSGQGLQGDNFRTSVLGFSAASGGSSEDETIFEKGGLPDPRLLTMPDLVAIPTLIPMLLESVRLSSRSIGPQ